MPVARNAGEAPAVPGLRSEVLTPYTRYVRFRTSAARHRNLSFHSRRVDPRGPAVHVRTPDRLPDALRLVRQRVHVHRWRTRFTRRCDAASALIGLQTGGSHGRAAAHARTG